MLQVKLICGEMPHSSVSTILGSNHKLRWKSDYGSGNQITHSWIIKVVKYKPQNFASKEK